MAEKKLSYLTRWQLAVRDAEGYARGEVTARRDDDPRLTPTEVAVAFVMSTYANSRDGRNVRPGAAAIARGAGVALPTAKAVRARLVAAGWLAVVHRGGSIEHGRREPSEYRLTIPTGSPPLPVTDDDRSSREHRPVAQDSPTGSPRLPNPVENLSNELVGDPLGKSDDDNEAKIVEVLELVADRRVGPGKPPAYRRTTVENMRTEEGLHLEAARLIERFDAPAGLIAAALSKEPAARANLAYYRRQHVGPDTDDHDLVDAIEGEPGPEMVRAALARGRHGS